MNKWKQQEGFFYLKDMENYIEIQAQKIYQKEKLKGLSLQEFDKKLDELNQKYLKEIDEFDWVKICIVLKDLVKNS